MRIVVVDEMSSTLSFLHFTFYLFSFSVLYLQLIHEIRWIMARDDNDRPHRLDRTDDDVKMIWKSKSRVLGGKKTWARLTTIVEEIFEFGCGTKSVNLDVELRGRILKRKDG